MWYLFESLCVSLISDWLLDWMIDALIVDTWYLIKSLCGYLILVWVTDGVDMWYTIDWLIYWLWVPDIWLSHWLRGCLISDWLFHCHNDRLTNWSFSNCFTYLLTSKGKWDDGLRRITSHFNCFLYTVVPLTAKSCLFPKILGTPHSNSSLNSLLSTTTIQLMSKSVLTAARVMGSFYSDDKLFIQIRYTQTNIALFENHVHAELRIIFCCALEQFRRAFILIHDDNSRKLRGAGGEQDLHLCNCYVFMSEPLHNIEQNILFMYPSLKQEVKRGWTVDIIHSIRMSGTELLHRRPVQCNHSVVSHDARLIDCFYQGYNAPSKVSHWICGMRFFFIKIANEIFFDRLF
jgi:hypothetical protein